MNEDEKEIEAIESYLKGELTGEALADMESKIVRDAAFAEKVEDYSLIIQEVKHMAQQDFVKKVKSWEHKNVTEDFDPDAGHVPNKKKQYLALAAVFVLLIVSGIVWLANRGENLGSSEDLFASYFHPYDDMISERSENNGNKVRLNEAMDAYNRRDYRAAIPLFQDYLKASDDPGARCYLGIAHLAAGDADAAESNFRQLSTQPAGLYLELSQWYLVLTYIKQKNLDMATQQLQVLIKDEKHLFHRQALELRKDLNRD
ncbi:tetratricopeptide repeat protein [Fulvivirgaceae bacterium BMA12]|uniref:Tetratricopeptide repeat protein n=1 Tax=Agaribacillus aureus TaxID=3051825 RepID=A0ABT8LHD3_9BACT|nr:tetratricopeptide repeat protein [Fulvivirgaceae bacterium BMA12]